MGDFRFGVWRLGLLSACGGQATSVNDSPASGNTASGNVGGTDAGSGTDAGGAGGTGSGTSSTNGATVTGQAATNGATTGSGGHPAPDVDHRVEPAVCDPFTPSPDSAIPPKYLGEGGAAGASEFLTPDFQCEFDSDCTDGNNGDCYFYSETYDQTYEGTRCSYGCQVDADCAVGNVCE